MQAKDRRLSLATIDWSKTKQSGDPKRYFRTFGEKEHTSKRVSIIAPDNAISEAKCATCTRLRRRTLRCTLHYASKLARSRCKANLSFSKTRGAEEMFVAGQQLTSLSPPKNPTIQSGFLPSKERLNHNKTKKQKVTIKVDYILLASICN